MLDLAPHRRSAQLPELSVDLKRAAQRSNRTPTEWTDADIERAIDRYRRFLALCRDNPGATLAPTRDIDIIWRLHRQTPQAYREDCVALLGGLLDHVDGFGVTPEERPTLIATCERTAARWRQAFGLSYVTATDARSAHRCPERTATRTSVCADRGRSREAPSRRPVEPGSWSGSAGGGRGSAMTHVTWTRHARERSDERNIDRATIERIVREPFCTRRGKGGAVVLVGRALCDERWCFVQVIAKVGKREGDYIITVVTAY